MGRCNLSITYSFQKSVLNFLYITEVCTYTCCQSVTAENVKHTYLLLQQRQPKQQEILDSPSISPHNHQTSWYTCSRSTQNILFVWRRNEDLSVCSHQGISSFIASWYPKCFPLMYIFGLWSGILVINKSENH